MEQFRVATGGAEDHSPSAGQNQYFVLPDGRYCNSQGVPTSSSSSGGVFFPDVGGGGMADPLSCPMGYSHGSLYFTGDMQYTGKGQATDNPQTPQTPTSIPDIILTGPGADDAALLKSALQQHRQQHGLKNDQSSPLGSFDSSDLFSTEEALRAGLDPIDIDGLQILTDPDMAVISDPAAEEAFRLDRS